MSGHRWRNQRTLQTGTAARGYGTAHQHLRRQLELEVQAGRAICWRCGDPITPGPWHLGHDDHDRSITRGPEHVTCNLHAAAVAGHRAAHGEPKPQSYQRPRPRSSGRWVPREWREDRL